MIRVMEIQWINLQGKKGFENIFTSVKPEMGKYIVFDHDDYDDDDEDKDDLQLFLVYFSLFPPVSASLSLLVL